MRQCSCVHTCNSYGSCCNSCFGSSPDEVMGNVSSFFHACICKKYRSNVALTKGNITRELTKECKELREILRTVLAVSFYMTLFSTAIALILPVASITVTGPVPINPTVKASARARRGSSARVITGTSWTTRGLENKHKLIN